MSYLHLEKNWPIAISIVAHITALCCINNSSTSPIQTSAPLKTITVKLVELQPREIPYKVTQLVQTPVIVPLIKTVTIQKVTSATEPITTPTITVDTQPTQNTAQANEAVTESHMEQVTEIPPAKSTVEYTPPSLSAEYLHNPVPKYPLIAKRMGQQGHVLLQVTVSETGQAVVVVVLQSSGYALLDQSAVQAVKNWQFVPARANQQAVTAQVTVPVRFTLES